MGKNNEPVAFINEEDGLVCAKCYKSFKTLTDEEIKDIWCDVYNFPKYNCLTELDYKFCKEIIRKAQEKC